MRIPSGDLAPARKHRRRYGRRRSPLPIVLVVLLVAAVAAGTYLVRRDDTGAGAVTASSRCASSAPVASKPASPAPAAKRATPVRLPAPGQVVLQLLNGTGRDGLARTVGNELARRGFRVGGMGNAPGLAGPSRVYYGPGARPAALLVSAHVLGAAVVPVPTAGRGTVRVVLGSSFVRLRTGPEVTAFVRGLTSPAAASRPVAPKPAASPTCR